MENKDYIQNFIKEFLQLEDEVDIQRESLINIARKIRVIEDEMCDIAHLLNDIALKIEDVKRTSPPNK